jgi:hypothetical protein
MINVFYGFPIFALSSCPAQMQNIFSRSKVRVIHYYETWAILEFPTVTSTQTSKTVSGSVAIIVITYEWRDTTPDDPNTNIPGYVEIGRETKASTDVSMTVQRVG